MENGYDRYEDSRAVVERLFRLAHREWPPPDSEEWVDIRREAEALYADDVELVTRDGVLHGPGRIFDDLTVQMRRFEIRLDLRQVLEAPDGRVVAVTKFTRRSRANPKDHFWNLGGGVHGVRCGMIVFFEGFPSAIRACEDVGIDPSLVA